MQSLLTQLEPLISLFDEQPGLQAIGIVVATLLIAKLLEWTLTRQAGHDAPGVRSTTG
jgi:hypothetical protein